MSRSKRIIEDTKDAIMKMKEKQGIHVLNTADKINMASLSVQRISMNVEVKQTKIISFATQKNTIKSQIKSARIFTLIVCPTYDETNIHWRRVVTLMNHHAELSKKMASLTKDKDLSQSVQQNIPTQCDGEDSFVLAIHFHQHHPK